MTDIKIAFWNLGNLFDINLSETALVHEFTPARGWAEEVLDKKIENLAEVIRLLNDDGQGPDLLGICEVENEKITQKSKPHIVSFASTIAKVKTKIILATILIVSVKVQK